MKTLTVTLLMLQGVAFSAPLELGRYVLRTSATGLKSDIPIQVVVKLDTGETNPIPEKADPIGILTVFPYEDDHAADTVMESYRADPDLWHGQALRVAAAGFGIRGDLPMFRETALRLYREDTNRLDSAILAAKALVVVPETRPEARSLLLSNLERHPMEPQLLKLLSLCDLADKKSLNCHETTTLLLDAVENDSSVLETVVMHVLLATTLGDGGISAETAERLARKLETMSETEIKENVRTLLFIYGSILRHSSETGTPDLARTAEVFLSRGTNPFEQNGGK